MITKLEDIITKAREKGRQRLAVACADDEHTLSAVYDAEQAGLVMPVLYGSEKGIKTKCQAMGINPAVFEIVDISDDLECVAQAVQAVATGQAQVLMKGLVSTDKYMRGILNKEAGLFPPKGLLSHVAVVELPSFGKLLIFTDAAVIPAPDFKQKTVLVKYLAQTAKALQIGKPRIACIAPSEQLLPGVESSTDGAILAKMAGRGQLGDIILDGPLSLDVALYAEAAKEKKVKGSDVAGNADCLLFPNIESANVFFKSATHFGNAEMAAMVMGTKVPCVLTSRGDTPRTKLYSIALACLSAN